MELENEQAGFHTEAPAEMNYLDLDYSEYIEIADGVYWVGFADKKAGLHCNPYLIVDGDEAVLLDSGSRDDFSTVMLKIMRTGVNPRMIRRLIYHHYDPDLCGNIPHMEAMINSTELEILSHYENNIFINYYSAKSPKKCIESLDFSFEFSSGRRLQFIRTPYSHSPGSFVTYDTKTKVLFSSDLFGSYDNNWSLYTPIDASCKNCTPQETCPLSGKVCQIMGILNFHKRIMPSSMALRYALAEIEQLDLAAIAPQHGSILHTKDAREAAIRHLKELPRVGMECFLE